MDRDQPMTFGDWMVTILIMAIPLVNLVAIIYWAASSGTNLNKQNYARASIAWFIIWVVIAIFLSLIGVALPGLSGTGLAGPGAAN